MIILTLMALSALLIGRAKEGAGTAADGRGEVLLIVKMITATSFKGILHQKIFYCLNLIFWIVMGCGIARFGQRGLKTTET